MMHFVHNTNDIIGHIKDDRWYVFHVVYLIILQILAECTESGYWQHAHIQVSNQQRQQQQEQQQKQHQ